MPVESATTELSLPGLDVTPTAPESKPHHWIERGPRKRLMVFSGRSHPDLALRIAEHLGVDLGEIELKTFANGETYCRYCESIRGADVFLVQTGCPPVDQHLMELLLMIQAAKLASAKRITAVIPWFPYSRQDRKAKPREPISGRLVADMLQLAGADRVLTMDLHAGQIQGFFTIPVDHMTALPLFAQHFRDLGLVGDGVVSVAPDAGRAKSCCAVMWSTGIVKKPWICPAWRSIVSSRSTPASCSMSATRRPEIGSRGFALRSWREYGNHGMTAVIRFADASFAAWIIRSSSIRCWSTGGQPVCTRKTSAPRIDSQ